jgi:hypothetical protein
VFHRGPLQQFQISRAADTVCEFGIQQVQHLAVSKDLNFFGYGWSYTLMVQDDRLLRMTRWRLKKFC